MFCPRCGEKNPGYAICCSKCGLTLAEIQSILERQAENDPVLARFASTIGAEGGNETGTTQPGAVCGEPAEISPAPEKPEGTATPPEQLTAVQLKDKGNEFYKAGKYLDAIDCYEKAIAIDQFYKEAWYNKSIALKKIEREDQAKVCWGIYKRLEALEKKEP